ncbi:MAG: helix-turn-helix transcriptional regulator [Gemmatimonadaceae bacterium]|nr:helix-turn-helix transcriptional regulator [Gemmatimonadaceae bacterium]
MIRTDAEYQDALKRLQQDRGVIQAQREALGALNLNADEVERALEPAFSFHEQLREEVEVYERMRRGDITPVESLSDIGRVLIGLRIARGITQRQLAERMNVSETQVSRDERNDYHGITVERAQRIILALHGKVRVEAELPLDDDLLVPA